MQHLVKDIAHFSKGSQHVVVKIVAIAALVAAATNAIAQDSSKISIFGESKTVENLEQDWPQHTIETISTWTGDEVIAYQGPLLQSILPETIGTTDTVTLTALDGFTVKIPLTDIQKFRPILATRQEGKKLNIEAKGPARVIWPRSQFPDQITIINDSYWIWYVSSISN